MFWDMVECMALALALALASTTRIVVVHVIIILLNVIGSSGGHHIVPPPKPARPELLLRICRDTVALNAEAYKRSYNMAIENMREGMEQKGFAKFEGGEAPERIYVLSQCMEDLAPANCTQCFRAIHNMMSNCFPATGGRIVYWGCYIRVENYSFFAFDIEPGDTRMTKCSDAKNVNKEFAAIGTTKLNELVENVAEKEYDVVYKRESNVLFVGVAVCWRSLDKKNCVSCLAEAKRRCMGCLNGMSTECRLLNSGCAMRYADYDFTNNPQKHLLREILSLYTSYVLGGLAVSTFIAAVGIYLSRLNYRRRASQRSTNNGVKRVHIKFKLSEKGLNFMEFNYSTLDKSTECFADSHRLGQGGYGEVFKGTLPDGREIAIKRLFATSGNSQSEEICNEIDIISRAQHRNLVRFLGCCFTNANSFLVYEYLVNKSLDRILFDSEKKKDLDWKQRWQIILGTAEGLEYLHKGCQLRIIHRDIKASNILLDAKWRPKIADFGLARFSSCGQNISSATIAGTFGYLAPEYLAQGRLTEKVDVYSFGVLLLEIVSGVRNNKLWSDSTFETLVTYVWKKFQSDTVSEIIAKELEVEENYIEKDVKRVVQVGLLCTQESPDLRPNMTMVIGMLKQDRDSELPLPTQPPFIDEHLEFSSSLGSFRWQPSLGLKL